jgi:hypothetical protein
MEVSGLIHAPAALPPGKDPSVPIVQEDGWAPEPVWKRWRREKNHCTYRESNSGRPASSLVTILTEMVELYEF